MYASLARFGYGIAKSLRPSKLKRGMRIAGDKVVKKRLDPAKSPKLSAYEDKGLNFMSQAGSKPGRQNLDLLNHQVLEN